MWMLCTYLTFVVRKWDNITMKKCFLSTYHPSIMANYLRLAMGQIQPKKKVFPGHIPSIHHGAHWVLVHCVPRIDAHTISLGQNR